MIGPTFRRLSCLLSEMVWLRLIRWPNLLVVGITQYGFRLPWEKAIKIPPPTFAEGPFALFVLMTLCITAAGYVVNDALDTHTDHINRPQKVIVGQQLSLSSVLVTYGALTAIGLAIALFLTLRWSQPFFLILHLGTSGLLVLYSRLLKQQPLAGNLLVAGLCAAAPGAVWWMAKGTYAEIETPLYSKMSIWAGLFIGFSFWVSLYREMVKDLEDVEGDRYSGCRTLPVLMGIEKSKTVTVLIAVVLWIGLSLGIGAGFSKLPIWIPSFGLLAVWLPLGISIRFLLQAQSSQDFHRLSQWLKWIMLPGLVVLVVGGFFLFQL